MEKLRRWLKARRFTLESGREDCVDVEGRCVTLSKSLGYQSRLAALLHECGHVSVYLGRLRAPRRRVAGATLREFRLDCGRRSARARAGRVAVLEEELAAWQQGEALARRLGVRISLRRFERERCAALMTYVAWCQEPMRRRRPAAHTRLST